MRKRDARIEALRAVQRELDVADAALTCLTDRLRTESDYLTRQQLQQQDVARWRDQLEVTYVIRLFAEFEAILREYWATQENTEPPMRDLLDGLASRQQVRSDWHQQAHKLRAYRNDLVHRTTELNPVPFTDAVQITARFLSQLPPEW